MSNKKAFFHSFQTCNLIGRAKDVHDNALMAQKQKQKNKKQNGNKILCQPTGWNGKSGVAPKVFPLFWKIPFDPCVPSSFQAVEPKILAILSWQPAELANKMLLAFTLQLYSTLDFAKFTKRQVWL